MPSPALARFLASFGPEAGVAQVLIRREADGFELRHEVDRHADAGGLRAVPVRELRGMAQVTAAGAYRPIKAAPNLVSGWRSVAADGDELGVALEALYPGALADWHALQNGTGVPSHYREYTSRQTGMYRITQMLGDAEVARTVRACCAVEFCLKRRLWTAPGLEPDGAGAKSVIPCWEPCAVLLEFARTSMRVEQADRLAVSRSDLESVRAVLAGASGPAREADFSDPGNPRRVRLLREKLDAWLQEGSPAAG